MADVVDHDDPERDRVRGRERGRDGRDDDDDDHDREVRRQRRVRQQRRAVLMETIRGQFLEFQQLFDRPQVQQVLFSRAVDDGSPYGENWDQLERVTRDELLTRHEERLKELLELPWYDETTTLSQLRARLRLAAVPNIVRRVRRDMQGPIDRLRQEHDNIDQVLTWLDIEGPALHRRITQNLQELQQLIDDDFGREMMEQFQPGQVAEAAADDLQEYVDLIVFSVPDKRIQLDMLHDTLDPTRDEALFHRQRINTHFGKFGNRATSLIERTVPQVERKVESAERTFIYEGLQRSSNSIPPRPPPPRP
mmetsp:Transcript_5697/g.13843  ORF Transcript_5697/g.13843 Transcript_5697/m.13843 type:complete len:308 (-) Transcript_5697:106-1029(-)|eukprot:CAMPEP_0113477548 /NCGR_PEP_ID=MMETSP0014_2-20120614/20265_1 /TAXON_ID=2857 /ORGANISM="Nitzschia sp." /LENGTH=307 /DNA_ID=CAMNT_0000370647 /DNA_START=102 /DNA_END=1025 /DNA_ORIENTATION=+ /assembly_acc=CAM_ASM_000159